MALRLTRIIGSSKPEIIVAGGITNWSITPVAPKMPMSATDSSTSWPERNPQTDFDYTSARMKTEGFFSQKYGRFEFRAQFPAGRGFWPAFWLMPEHSPYGGWPACGEIDIVENKGNYPAVVQGTIHYAGPQGGYRHASGLYTFLPNDGATNCHTYGLDWTTNSIQWFVDGKLYETQDRWSTVNAPYPAPFDQPFYIIMNLAVGGDFGGNPDTNTVFPGEIQVDYVRVYEHTNP